MTDSAKPPLPTPLALTRAVREFLATEVVGGIALVIAVAVALAWANSPWQDSYHELWNTELSVGLGRWHLGLSLREWAGEGLMAIFFLVVGLEVKREFLQGELSDRRRAMLPVVAAVGGMVVPALIYALINGSGAGADGWAVPMATDIAFALGVLALIAPGVPPSLRIFLLAFAIVDDIGAIIVIAVFYSGSLDAGWAAAAIATIVVVYVLRRIGLTFTPLIVALGCFLWVAVHGTGLSATLAGVVMGLLAPATAKLDREIIVSQRDELLDVFSPEAARTTSRLARHAVSRLEWLEHSLHPWTSLLVVPVFALANSGVTFRAATFGDALSSPVTIGVAAGLVIGKTVGITGAAWLCCRTGWAELPTGSGWRQLIGVGALGGIGFTVSLFIAGLAFDRASVADEAKIGIFAAAIVATALAAILLRTASSPSEPAPEDAPGSPAR